MPDYLTFDTPLDAERLVNLRNAVPKQRPMLAAKVYQTFMVNTAHGYMVAQAGDYLVVDPERGMFPMRAHVFENEYDLVPELT